MGGLVGELVGECGCCSEFELGADGLGVGVGFVVFECWWLPDGRPEAGGWALFYGEGV